jgi:hypothetical protein
VFRGIRCFEVVTRKGWKYFWSAGGCTGLPRKSERSLITGLASSNPPGAPPNGTSTRREDADLDNMGYKDWGFVLFLSNTDRCADYSVSLLSKQEAQLRQQIQHMQSEKAYR